MNMYVILSVADMRIRCLSVIPFKILSQICELNPTLKYKTYLCRVHHNINITEAFSLKTYQKPVKISTGHNKVSFQGYIQ